MEQGRTPPFLVHFDQLARQAAALVRDSHQPDQQHDQPRRTGGPRPSRSSAVSDRQESLRRRTQGPEHRARRLPRRLELRHQAAPEASMIARLVHSRALRPLVPTHRSRGNVPARPRLRSPYCRLGLDWGSSGELHRPTKRRESRDQVATGALSSISVRKIDSAGVARTSAST